jgi:hypothetical protein
MASPGVSDNDIDVLVVAAVHDHSTRSNRPSAEGAGFLLPTAVDDRLQQSPSAQLKIN